MAVAAARAREISLEPVVAERLDAARRDRVAAALAGAGRLLVATGLVILGFVGYTLIGTNWAEARHQRELRSELGAIPPPEPIEASVPNDDPAPPPPPTGKAIAVLRLPRIGVEKAVVEGVDLRLLKQGPGHYPGTPLPGQPGNAAIAGHRTTYGAPFFRLDEMRPGDPILVSTTQGQFRYDVREVKRVKPTAVEVVGPTADNRLTLTTCHPRFSAAERLVLVADLVGPAAPPSTRATVPAGQVAAAAQPREPVVDEVVGAAGDPAARVPTVLWGLAALAIAAVAAVAGRRWRRLPAYALAAVPFLGALWSFYASLARLIPS